MLSKKEIRSEAKQRIAAVNDRPERSRKLAKNVCAFLSSLRIKKGAPIRIGLFLSMDSEIDTNPLIQMLRKVSDQYVILVPRVEDRHEMNFFTFSESSSYQISKYGVCEPCAPVSEAQVPTIILVPGLAFDKNGGRVGHGKGYYDRYFTRYEKQIAYRIALAYDIQLFDKVPMDAYDQYMDAIITDQQVILAHQKD